VRNAAHCSRGSSGSVLTGPSSRVRGRCRVRRPRTRDPRSHAFRRKRGATSTSCGCRTAGRAGSWPPRGRGARLGVADVQQTGPDLLQCGEGGVRPGGDGRQGRRAGLPPCGGGGGRDSLRACRWDGGRRHAQTDRPAEGTPVDHVTTLRMWSAYRMWSVYRPAVRGRTRAARAAAMVRARRRRGADDLAGHLGDACCSAVGRTAPRGRRSARRHLPWTGPAFPTVVRERDRAHRSHDGRTRPAVRVAPDGRPAWWSWVLSPVQLAVTAPAGPGP
jgi:hypothetical protein